MVIEVFLATGVLWGFNVLFGSPLLASAAIRNGLDRWPTSRPAANLLAATALVTVGQIIAIGATVLAAGGRLRGTGVFVGVGGSLVGVAVGTWVIVVWLFPLSGRWRPSQPDGALDGRLVLTGALLVYLGGLGLGALLALMAAIAIGFPG
ncbi:MAG: hypothetical protein ABEJ35_01470 [Halobacteriaceae archaeon]